MQNPEDGHMIGLCNDVAVLVAETNLVEQEVSLLASPSRGVACSLG